MLGIAIIATVLALVGCGIKGPLKLPPGKSAPAPTGLPPGAPPTTIPGKPSDTPAPVEPAPEENKDKKQ